MKRLTPIKAIRAKCLDCCAGQNNEVKLCPVEKCPLYPYRFGHRPKESNYTTNDSFSEKGTATCEFQENMSMVDDEV